MRAADRSSAGDEHRSVLTSTFARPRYRRNYCHRSMSEEDDRFGCLQPCAAAEITRAWRRNPRPGRAFPGSSLNHVKCGRAGVAGSSSSPVFLHRSPPTPFVRCVDYVPLREDCRAVQAAADDKIARADRHASWSFDGIIDISSTGFDSVTYPAPSCSSEARSASRLCRGPPLLLIICLLRKGFPSLYASIPSKCIERHGLPLEGHWSVPRLSRSRRRRLLIDTSSSGHRRCTVAGAASSDSKYTPTHRCLSSKRPNSHQSTAIFGLMLWRRLSVSSLEKVDMRHERHQDPCSSTCPSCYLLPSVFRAAHHPIHECGLPGSC